MSRPKEVKMTSDRPMLCRESYEVGMIEFTIKLARGYTQPITLGNLSLSIQGAKDAIKALQFALERLHSEGLIPLE